MKKFICIIMFMLGAFPVSAQPQYSKDDSIKVVALLKGAPEKATPSRLMVYFARQMKGIPYVAQTLEKNAHERLVINLRQLDCTTYVENVLALTRCSLSGQRSFAAFCKQLQMIRYEQGKVAYPQRLHYFSEWIADNTRKGYVKEVQAPNPPFTKVQKLDIDYMSKHASHYPMLVKHPAWTKEIQKMEKRLNGKTFRYIPKATIANTSLFRKTIHDGDIIAIITQKAGLDTSHIGIAVWHADGLHMLNASQIRHQVVEEPMTLYSYMKKHPSQTGIRIIRVR